MAASPDRDFIDAKLEAVESRMDARVASIESALAAFTALMAERGRHFDLQMTPASPCQLFGRFATVPIHPLGGVTNGGDRANVVILALTPKEQVPK